LHIRYRIYAWIWRRHVVQPYLNYHRNKYFIACIEYWMLLIFDTLFLLTLLLFKWFIMTSGEFGNPLRKFKLVFLGEQSGMTKQCVWIQLCVFSLPLFILDRKQLSSYYKAPRRKDTCIPLSLWNSTWHVWHVIKSNSNRVICVAPLTLRLRAHRSREFVNLSPWKVVLSFFDSFIIFLVWQMCLLRPHSSIILYVHVLDIILT